MTAVTISLQPPINGPRQDAASFSASVAVLFCALGGDPQMGQISDRRSGIIISARALPEPMSRARRSGRSANLAAKWLLLGTLCLVERGPVGLEIPTGICRFVSRKRR